MRTMNSSESGQWLLVFVINTVTIIKVCPVFNRSWVLMLNPQQSKITNTNAEFASIIPIYTVQAYHTNINTPVKIPLHCKNLCDLQVNVWRVFCLLLTTRIFGGNAAGMYICKHIKIKR